MNKNHSSPTIGERGDRGSARCVHRGIRHGAAPLGAELGEFGAWAANSPSRRRAWPQELCHTRAVSARLLERDVLPLVLLALIA